MNKLFLVSGFVILALSLMVGGVIFAQEDDAADDTGDLEATAWLGVMLVETDDGVVIARVQAGSPAAASDLLIGDVIESFDGETVESVDVLVEMIQAHAPGDAVTVGVLRNDEAFDIDVTLIANPTSLVRRGRSQAVNAGSMTGRMFGVNLEETDAGYEVIGILPTNPFELEIGDVIIEVNGQPVEDLDWQTIMTEMVEAEDATLSITVVRDGEELSLEGDVFGRMRGFGDMDSFGGREGMRDFGGGRDGRGGPGGMDSFGDQDGTRDFDGDGFNGASAPSAITTSGQL
jgi:C-terminal processing protease CtpA/Prc